MVRKVSAMGMRNRLGQILEEVYYRGDAFIIERAGRPMAALVPLAEYEHLQARRAERFRIYKQIKARTKTIPSSQLDQAIAEGVRAARSQR